MNNVVKEPTAVFVGAQSACLDRIKRLLHYLEDDFHCVFPAGTNATAEMLYEVACDTFYPTVSTAKAIIKEWHIWKEYLSKDSYSNFVLGELIDLFQIHVAGTSSSRYLRSYVGYKTGVTVIKEPPAHFSTYVCLSGKLLKNGVEQK